VDSKIYETISHGLKLLFYCVHIGSQFVSGWP